MTIEVHAAAQQAAEFHGHMCPGLAIGVRAAEVALSHIGPHSTDEEVVAVVETDYGKNAFTFYRRSDARALRIASRPQAWGPRDPQREALSRRVRAGEGSVEDDQAFEAMQHERSEAILDAPVEQLFSIEPIDGPVPRKARIHASLNCDRCGEQAMETRVRHFGGHTLCMPCFERLEPRV